MDDLATLYGVREIEIRSALQHVSSAEQSLRSGVVWLGVAATAAGDTASEICTLLERIARNQGEIGTSLREWAGTVERLQGRADRALEQARVARDDLTDAHARLDRATIEAADAEVALTRVSPDDPRPWIRSQYAQDAANARGELVRSQNTASDAASRLSAATADAAAARDEYDTAAWASAAAFTAAADALRGAGAVPDGLGAALVALASGREGATTSDELLRLLKTLTPEQLAALAAENPSILQSLWDDPPAPDQVARWWNALDVEEQTALVALAPAILGNLAGLPYGIRDRANRAVLRAATASYDDLTDAQKRAVDQMNALRRRAGIDDVPFQITALHLGARPPLGAFAYGDLDSADNVTWAAPGMDNDFDNRESSWGRATLNLYEEQRRLGAGAAVVGWMGYDTPDMVSVLGEGLARAGAARFAVEIDGTHAVRAGSASGMPHIAVVAHSYGTTMAADALILTTHPVDSFTMVGSAGIDQGWVAELSDLNVARVHGIPAVYTTSATLDDLAPYGAYLAGRENPNPTQADVRGWDIRGAWSFSSDGQAGFGPAAGHGVIGHGDDRSGFLGAEPPEGQGYFDKGTQSLRGIAATSTGQPERVPGALVPTADQDRP
ncbi:alpha/beta hydrolase [Microbacterium sp. RU33B]|uniref:alpha/beta hydrolase n=1 Tax=Microbacterium sp. RU33B TaxID=1907390 RepID=UPI0009FB58BF|nr:alpha/beta hydrolase [Microbacterium sp. RU33B]